MRHVSQVHINEMPFGTRSRNVLLWSGIKTVGDLARFLSNHRPEDLKHCGVKSAIEIKTVARPYLEALAATDGLIKALAPLSLPKVSQLKSRPAVIWQLSATEAALAKDILIEEMNLGTRALNAARTSRFKTAYDIAHCNPEKFLDQKNVGVTVLEEVRVALGKALANPPQKKIEEEMKPCGAVRLVDRILESLDNRSALVLSKRFGLWDGVDCTLEEIAQQERVSRERVRQLEARAMKTLPNRFRKSAILAYLQGFIKGPAETFLRKNQGIALREEVKQAIFSEGHSKEVPLAFDFLTRLFNISTEELFASFPQAEEGSCFDSAVSKKRFEEAISAIRMLLVSKGVSMDLKELSTTIAPITGTLKEDFIRRCAEVSSSIGMNAVGRVGLRRWPHFAVKTICDMAQNALLAIGRPAHFTHIVEKMNSLFPNRAPFSNHSVHGRLVFHRDVFNNISRGHYALVNWGIKRPPKLVDFLADAARRNTGEANIEEVVQEGMARYGMKESSLKWTLTAKPHIFKLLPEGKYRLL